MVSATASMDQRVQAPAPHSAAPACRPHTDAGNDACPAHQRWFLFHYSPNGLSTGHGTPPCFSCVRHCWRRGLTLHAFGYQIRRENGKRA